MKWSKNVVLIITLISSFSLFGQREWESVTLEYEYDDYYVSSYKSRQLLTKFWMDFKHGVFRMSNTNNDSIIGKNTYSRHYYYTGSYFIDFDTITITLHSRMCYEYKSRKAIDMNEFIKRMPIPEGGIPEQYRFLILKEDQENFELIALESFWGSKDVTVKRMTDRLYEPMSFTITDQEYKWLSRTELLEKVPVLGRCGGVHR